MYKDVETEYKFIAVDHDEVRVFSLTTTKLRVC